MYRKTMLQSQILFSPPPGPHVFVYDTPLGSTLAELVFLSIERIVAGLFPVDHFAQIHTAQILEHFLL